MEDYKLCAIQIHHKILKFLWKAFRIGSNDYMATVSCIVEYMIEWMDDPFETDFSNWVDEIPVDSSNTFLTYKNKLTTSSSIY